MWGTRNSISHPFTLLYSPTHHHSPDPNLLYTKRLQYGRNTQHTENIKNSNNNNNMKEEYPSMTRQYSLPYSDDQTPSSKPLLELKESPHQHKHSTMDQEQQQQADTQGLIAPSTSKTLVCNKKKKKKKIALKEKVLPPSMDNAEPDEAMAEDNGRERLKRHRVSVAGRVCIPEIWGQEDLLRDWIDCTAFHAPLVPSKDHDGKSSFDSRG